MPLLGDETKSSTLSRNATTTRSGLSRHDGWGEPQIGEWSSYVPERNRGSQVHRATGFAGLFSNCANPACASGWMHLWRSRSAPVFEGGWSCSASCTAARMEAAVRRELGGRRELEDSHREPVKHRHRVPLGLVMLEQGWISPKQLRQALEAQKGARQGKLGQWLVRQQGVSEQLVTRALGLQWSCPVLTLDNHDPEAVGSALPRLFVEAFGALPLRVAAGTILYLGFEDRLDPVVALAAERMLGLRIEAGLVRDSLFGSAHQRMLNAGFPTTQLMETASELPITRVLARAVERVKPVESRLVRLHDCLWLRMWSRPQTGPLPETTGVEDMICSLIAS